VGEKLGGTNKRKENFAIKSKNVALGELFFSFLFLSFRFFTRSFR
jgi:hypothetical protein